MASWRHLSRTIVIQSFFEYLTRGQDLDEILNYNLKEYADKISRLFKDLLPLLNINNNYFIRTTDSDHIRIVKNILSKIVLEYSLEIKPSIGTG